MGESCPFWHPHRLDYVTACHRARAGIHGAMVKTTGSGATETIPLPHASWFLVAVTSLYLSFSIFKMGSGETYSPGSCKDLILIKSLGGTLHPYK